MTGLAGITVHVEGGSPTYHVGNAVPILHEILHALERLQATGEASTIDLAAIPFGPGDREHLFDALGEGEVRANVDSLGETRIRETGYPGVWVVEYLSPSGDNELTAHIEITQIPSLLRTPAADLPDSLTRLRRRLGGDDSSIPEDRQE